MVTRARRATGPDWDKVYVTPDCVGQGACATLLQWRRLRAAIIQAVEQQLERSVRLVAEVDFRPEQDHFAFAQRCLGDGGTAIEILLAPCPSAGKDLGSLEPADWLRFLHLSGRLQTEDGVVVVEHIHLLGHAVSEGIGVVEVHTKKGTGDVELFARKCALSAVRSHFSEEVLYRKSQSFGDAGGTADSHNGAARFHEFLQLRQRLLGGDAADLILIFIGYIAAAASTAAAAASAAAAAEPASAKPHGSFR